MFDILAKIPWYGYEVLSVTIIIGLIIIIKMLKDRNLKVSKKGVELVDKDIVEHTTKNIFLIIEKVTSTGNQVSDLLNRQRLKEQMNYLEQKIFDLSGNIEDFYYKNISGTNIFKEFSFQKVEDNTKKFYLVMESAFNDVKTYIRSSFIENHYSSMSDETFSVYAREKSLAVLLIFKEKFKKFYIPNLFLEIRKTEEIKNIYDKLEESFRFTTEEVILSARKTSKRIENEAKSLTLEMQNYIAKLIETKVC